MVFSSLTFLLFFLPAVLAVYFAVPARFKNGVLFLFSLIFYAWGEPVYVCLMLFSTVLDYTCGRLVDSHRGAKKGKAALIVSICVNVGLLAVFKYSDLFIGTFNDIFGTALALPHLPLPIGISFYTFQTMSYTIDVYRGKAKVQKNIVSFGAYVALFPQLIAGPIVRYQTIADQLNERTHSTDLFGEGAWRFVTGLGKKVLLANNIGLLWDTVKAIPFGRLSVLGAWLGIIAFAFQIYFDFSGYSDMAIGLGRMFGFTFLENFNYPYLSKSITEFWRRWHISLGTWFRDYVYIPLGGSRCSIAKQLRNLAVVWLLTGFWHGASWNFLIWGVYFGVILIAEKLFLLKTLERLPKA
ncbi:MAG: MBOAT family protein, partial [Lachnospiraceae bacterium]|nr:MBOAT family protein [Lachnospiraceae bacterium]